MTTPDASTLLEASGRDASHVEDHVALSLGHYGSWRAIGLGSYAFFCSVPGLMNGGLLCDHYISGGGALASDSGADAGHTTGTSSSLSPATGADGGSARRGVILEYAHWSCCGSRTRMGQCLNKGGPSIAYCKALQAADPDAARRSPAVRSVLTRLAMPAEGGGIIASADGGARVVIVGDNLYSKSRRVRKPRSMLRVGDIVCLSAAAAPDHIVLRSHRDHGEVVQVDAGTGMVTVKRRAGSGPGEALAAGSSGSESHPITRQYLESSLELLPRAVTAASIIGAAAAAIGGAGRA